jgi:nicotinate dehydrogenase subunit A
VPINCQVNGVDHALSADADTPLMYCLRDELGLKGTRFGCGSGHCGACTVLVDGRAVQSCDTPLWAAAGHRVTTVEGLADDRVGTVLRQAFIDLQAAQCGYCINGILMAVTALLKQNARPDRAAILKALERNLCRCGTHVRILRAIDRAIALLNEGLS